MILIHIYYTGLDGSAKKFADEMTSSGTVGEVRAEAGNMQYDYFYPADDEETVLLIDRWENRTALDAHHKSETMTKIAALRKKYKLKMRVEKFILP